MKLLISAITKMIFGIALIGAMLFLPAWTWSYFGAWLFIGVLSKGLEGYKAYKTKVKYRLIPFIW